MYTGKSVVDKKGRGDGTEDHIGLQSSVKSIWHTLKICYVFIIATCSIMKAALFPNLGPPPSLPIQCSFTGDTLGKLIQH